MTASTAARTAHPDFGSLLRRWRERRRLTQLDLSNQSDISTRHLSFLETGRSRPTADMILRLAEHLDVPLRERNDLLLAGGFAPAYPEHALDGPELATVRASLRRVLDGHLPYPAVVLNRWWELVDANPAIAIFLEGVDPQLLSAPVNVIRLSLHPDGLAPRIENLPQWRGHLLSQLRRRVEYTADPKLRDLLDEVSGYPGGEEHPHPSEVVLPMRFRHGDTVLSTFSIAAQVGTAQDVTVSELMIESFYPADEESAEFLRCNA
jgi:transcriptional regulator with XRE-family HTH domain